MRVEKQGGETGSENAASEDARQLEYCDRIEPKK
jgi:hypothetical protein